MRRGEVTLEQQESAWFLLTYCAVPLAMIVYWLILLPALERRAWRAFARRHGLQVTPTGDWLDRFLGRICIHGQYQGLPLWLGRPNGDRNDTSQLTLGFPGGSPKQVEIPAPPGFTYTAVAREELAVHYYVEGYYRDPQQIEEALKLLEDAVRNPNYSRLRLPQPAEDRL